MKKAVSKELSIRRVLEKQQCTSVKKNTNSGPIKYRTVPRGGGGVFKIANNAGMIEWGQKSKPQKIPRASNKTPKKSPGRKINPPKKPCRISKP